MCKVKSALVKTSVITRQKYGYIFYSIPLSNISYGLISVYGASNTQLIALPQGYDLSRLRLHVHQKKKRKRKDEAIKKSDTHIGGQLCACFPH